MASIGDYIRGGGDSVKVRGDTETITRITTPPRARPPEAVYRELLIDRAVKQGIQEHNDRQREEYAARVRHYQRIDAGDQDEKNTGFNVLMAIKEGV